MTSRILCVLTVVAAAAFSCARPPRTQHPFDNSPGPLSPVANIDVSIAPSNGREVWIEVYDANGVQMGRIRAGVIDTTTTFRIETLWRVTADPLGSADSSLVNVRTFDSGIYQYRVKVADSTVASKRYLFLK